MLKLLHSKKIIASKRQRLFATISWVLLALLFVSIFPLQTKAQFGQDGYLRWQQDGSAIRITGHVGSPSAVNIPSSINGLPVTSIGNTAFYYCYQLTTVTIPNSVTNIGTSAFSGCSSLTNVTIPNSVINIDSYAFSDCSSLSNVTIPESVTSIGAGVFIGCTNLPAIIVESNNPAYCAVAGVLFDLNQTTLIAYPPGGAGYYTVPSSVTNIGSYAFAQCPKLTSVFFQSNAPGISVPATVFYCDTNVTVFYAPGTTGWGPTFDGSQTVMLNSENPTLLFVSITPDKAVRGEAQWQVDGGLWQNSGSAVTGLSVGYHTVSFSSISGWTTPASQTIVLGSKAIAAVSGVYTPEPFKFTINSDGVSLTITEYAGSATNLDIPTTLNGFRVSGIGNFAFRWCTNLINVNIGSSVTNIGFNPFLECDSLTAITVDPSNPAYSSIAGVLFDRTQTTLVSYPSHGPESYAIPSSVTSIGNFAFLFCAGVSNVIIGDSVTNIGRDAFAGCWLLNVTIGNHVTRIGERAFEYCIGLSNLAISDSVTSIGDLAFYGCYGLTNATFGTNVTSIGTNVFEGCDGLTSVTLPASLTNIGDFAFYQCNGLTNIVFDNCAARIGALAFADCSGLTSLTIPDSVISIGDSAFAACQALRNLTIGNGVNYIGSGAFFLCRSLTNVTIGNSVTTIGDNAFSDCYGLTNVFFQGNAPSVGSDWTVFSNDSTVTIYYLAGTSGWGDTFEGMPTALWTPTLTVQYVAPNVVLTWPSGVLIESTNLASAVWMTNAAAQSPYTVIPDGPQKFYRVKIN